MKVSPSLCNKCNTIGYPVCKFCNPKEFKEWYKGYFGESYEKTKQGRLT